MRLQITHIESVKEKAHNSLENDPNIQKLPSTVDSDILEEYWSNYSYCTKCWKHIRTYDQKTTYCTYNKVTILTN